MMKVFALLLLLAVSVEGGGRRHGGGSGNKDKGGHGKGKGSHSNSGGHSNSNSNSHSNSHSKTYSKSKDKGCDEDDVQCTSVWAKGADSVCLSQSGGWTNAVQKGETETMQIWSGAEHCATDNGVLVGTVEVSYIGSTVSVVAEMMSNWVIRESNLWVGARGLPYKRGKHSASPSQFPYNQIGGANYTVQQSGCDKAFVALHLDACELEETSAPPTSAPPTSSPPTSAPPTNAPPTSAPPTAAPQTVPPQTSAPPTSAPPTSAPPTSSPPTSAPPTSAPPTSAPPTPVPVAPTNPPRTFSPIFGPPTPPTPPGGDCLNQNGVTRKNGETWLAWFDGYCKRCTCNNGFVSCVNIPMDDQC